MKPENEIILIVVIIGSLLAVSQIVSIPINIESPELAKFIENNGLGSEDKNIITERRTAYLKVPAVDNEGNGIATSLKVEAIPGEGRTLTNIDHLLFWVDTQHSIQVAKAVAVNLTNVDLSKIDLIYTIETEAGVIEGPSAGAALALATVSVLENRDLNSSVSITGTINPDGSIGAVGGVLEKAKASRDAGIKLFLVPKGQGFQSIYSPVKECRLVGPINYCTVEYRRETVDITNQAGIEVREIVSVQEALKYFLT